MTSNPLARRLACFVDLDTADRMVIENWCRDTIDVRADKRFAWQSDHGDRIGVILSGWACRYKTLADGKRQIVGFLLPGDMCGVHALVGRRAVGDIVMLTGAVVALVTPQKLIDGVNASPKLAQALWTSTLVEAEIAHEWLLNIGQRSAIMRVAHLLCELWYRADIVGLSDKAAFAMPLTQPELGDALGLTSVHINRMLRDLRRFGLIALDRRLATIPDIAKLVSMCGFDLNYLHLKQHSEQMVRHVPAPTPIWSNIPKQSNDRK